MYECFEKLDVSAMSDCHVISESFNRRTQFGSNRCCQLTTTHYYLLLSTIITVYYYSILCLLIYLNGKIRVRSLFFYYYFFFQKKREKEPTAKEFLLRSSVCPGRLTGKFSVFPGPRKNDEGNFIYMHTYILYISVSFVYQR